MSRMFSAVALAFLMVFTLPAEACHKKKHRCGGGGGGKHGGHPPACTIKSGKYQSVTFQQNEKEYKLTVVMDELPLVVLTETSAEPDAHYYYLPARPRHGKRHGKGHKQGHPPPEPHGLYGQDPHQGHEGPRRRHFKPVCTGTTLESNFKTSKLDQPEIYVKFEWNESYLEGGVSIQSDNIGPSPLTDLQLTIQ